jgi:hypothetical protein
MDTNKQRLAAGISSLSNENRITIRWKNVTTQNGFKTPNSA